MPMLRVSTTPIIANFRKAMVAVDRLYPTRSAMLVNTTGPPLGYNLASVAMTSRSLYDRLLSISFITFIVKAPLLSLLSVQSYKDIANRALDSLRFAISTYSGLISMSTPSRPRRSATSKVVPLPANGSRTMHLPEPSLPSQVQVGSQRSLARSRSTTLFHGARHLGHAFGDVPARMHGSTSFSGNTAKWVTGDGCTAMVQTERLFRVAFSSLTAGSLIA